LLWAETFKAAATRLHTNNAATTSLLFSIGGFYQYSSEGEGVSPGFVRAGLLSSIQSKS